MKNEGQVLTAKVLLLKEARLKLLQLHKLFVDVERGDYEGRNGQVSSGQFLNLLLNDESFQWLRKFSVLIVEIDEMFDLDDGFTEAVVEMHFSQISNLVNFKAVGEEFENKYKDFMQKHREIAAQHSEIKKLLSNK